MRYQCRLPVSTGPADAEYPCNYPGNNTADEVVRWRVSFVSDTIAAFEGFAQGKLKKLQEAGGAKGTAGCAADL